MKAAGSQGAVGTEKETLFSQSRAPRRGNVQTSYTSPERLGSQRYAREGPWTAQAPWENRPLRHLF